MKKQYIAIVALWFIGGAAVAQNERDAFRYAQYSPTGTARYSALAGAMGSFGADFTALSANNPAGIGLYKRMELALTMAVPYNSISSTYNGETTIGTKSDINWNNIGMVFTFKTNSKWKMVQFGTGFNNLARYRGTSVVSGLNIGKKYDINDVDKIGQRGSTNFFDYVAENSYENPDYLKWISDVAYNYFLMDPYSNDAYSPRVINDDFRQRQEKIRDGALNEYIFTLGGNYDDKLFLGATLGVPFFNYNEKTTYTEIRESFNDTLGYSYFRYYEQFKSNATGINLKLGVIYQPVNFLRIGTAFHTPSWYPNVKESSEEGYNFESLYQPLDSLYYDVSELSPINRFNYQLTTPYRAMANVAFLFKKYGFINLDYEFTDYSTSTMQSNAYNFSVENNATRKYYQPTHTARIGGEVNLSPLSLRLGYSFTSNPYKKSANIDGTRHTISGGVGLKGKTFFADFAYMYRFTNDKDVFYDAASINPYSSSLVNQVFALTLGMKF
jgi:hypothetical protein